MLVCQRCCARGASVMCCMPYMPAMCIGMQMVALCDVENVAWSMGAAGSSRLLQTQHKLNSQLLRSARHAMMALPARAVPATFPCSS